MAFTLEQIWRTRNETLFNKSTSDLHLSILRNKLNEASHVLAEFSPPVSCPTQLLWTPPNWIKVNVDAALSSSKASLAVIVGDHNGVVIKI
nr:hypothetical protein CFP56_26821 [Quercus suber]